MKDATATNVIREIQKIKDQIDIVQIISEYISLKRTKYGNWVGLCPFHKESTPSFFVSPKEQIFYCFGCGHQGDVITFLMEKSSLTFAEAIKTLALRNQFKNLLAEISNLFLI